VNLWSSWRTENSWARVECSSDWEIMADVDNSARESDAIGAMMFLEKTDVVSDFVNVDVITLTSVRLSERVHGGKE